MSVEYDILIPTCKPPEEVQGMVDAILSTADPQQIIVSGFQVAAAVNRNYCLDRAKSKLVIMVDDDIDGFKPGWAEKLVHPLIVDSLIVMVSARLVNCDGTPGTMMDIEPDFSLELQTVKGYLPSACIAFHNDGSRFDENFIGSGWEDTDFCDTLHKRYGLGEFVINNSVQLIHHNEMKNGSSGNFALNRAYYMKKHGRVA